MIGALEGLLVDKTPELLLLDVKGVGYEVLVPLSTFLELPDEGKTVRLLVHTHVREDQLQLFGFLSSDERRVFRLLLGVSGVGPRLALAILSGLRPAELVRAIRREDLAALRGVPGVGVKTAQRILLELRDKLTGFEAEAERDPGDEVEGSCLSALLNLGYPRSQAEAALRRAREALPQRPVLEDLIREALRAVAR